jgi:hypothetical protein
MVLNKKSIKLKDRNDKEKEINLINDLNDLMLDLKNNNKKNSRIKGGEESDLEFKSDNENEEKE